MGADVHRGSVRPWSGRRRREADQAARSESLVTGGGSGIGEATCHHLAEHGHRVAVVDLDGGAAERVAKAVRADGGDAVGVDADVTDRAAVDAAFDDRRETFGPVEILVTSAGVCPFAPFADITIDQWQLAIDVNLTGTFHCCQAALPADDSREWGRIVIISSSSAQRGAVRAPTTPPRRAASSRSPSRSRLDVRVPRDHGERHPTVGHRDTDAARRPGRRFAARRTRSWRSAIPVGHLGTPDDIAAAVAFLASDEAGFITGQTLGVNGGQVL